MPEQLTIEGRAGFYEQTGAFRDMVVTHLFHLLGFVAMEAPARLDARSLRDESERVFQALKPLDPARVVFGQYDGYRREPGVAADSTVETFAALEVEVDNERWAGVPFQLRTGKALAESRTTVTLGFKTAPQRLFEAGRRRGPARPQRAHLRAFRPRRDLDLLSRQGAGRDDRSRRRDRSAFATPTPSPSPTSSRPTSA